MVSRQTCALLPCEIDGVIPDFQSQDDSDGGQCHLRVISS